MKLQVIERKFREHDKDYFSYSYKIKSCKYCCEEIKQIPNIDFYFEETKNTENPIEDDYGYGYDLGVMFVNRITTHDAWDDYEWTNEYFYKLNYCPICGEKFEIEVVDRIDVSKDYQQLVKEREEVHQKWNKTDSIKKQSELEKLRHELDMKIESFFHSDILPDKPKGDGY